MATPKRSIRSVGEIGVDLARGIQKKDRRYDRFWNYKPVPVLMDDGSGEGFFTTRKKITAAFGANRSTKTTANAFLAIVMYTGIIPPVLQGVWPWEQQLRDLTVGPNKRPRYVRVVVMDYNKHWPIAIRPMFLDDEEQGMLPEAWASNWDPVAHQFTGPDGSILDIFSADPQQDIDPVRLRGGKIDHTWIDEINRETVYTESASRPAASPTSPGIVSLSYCPQNGFDWTYDIFHNACYFRKGDRSYRKPAADQHPDIYSIKVSMKDNPSISAEAYESQKRRYRPWEVAFRVDGEYSERASNEYFHVDQIIRWEDRMSPGVAAIVHEVDVNPETGTFKGKLELLEDVDIIQEDREHDERYNCVWRIWEKPMEGEKYILSVDIAEGNVESDFHSASVWKCTDKAKPMQVAHLHIRQYKPGNLALQVCCMANVFGNCLVVPEANNTGGGMFLDRARRYVNMYKRIDQATQEDKPSEKTGWFTSKHNKGPMLDNAYKMLQQNALMREKTGSVDDEGMPVYRNYCPFNSRPTLGEFISYQEKLDRDKNGISKVTWGAPHSGHDDCVMEAVIAWKVIQDEFSKISTCKLSRSAVKLKKDKHYLGKKPRTTKAFSGLKKQRRLSDLGRGRGVKHAR